MPCATAQAGCVALTHSSVEGMSATSTRPSSPVRATASGGASKELSLAATSTVAHSTRAGGIHHAHGQRAPDCSLSRRRCRPRSGRRIRAAAAAGALATIFQAAGEAADDVVAVLVALHVGQRVRRDEQVDDVLVRTARP